MASLQQVMEQDGQRVFLDAYGFGEEIAIAYPDADATAVLAVVVRGGPEIQTAQDGTGTELRLWVDIELAANDLTGVANFAPEMTVLVDAKIYVFDRVISGKSETGTHAARFERLETDVERSEPDYRRGR